MKSNKCVMVDDDDTDSSSPRFACCMYEEFSEQCECTYYSRAPERGRSEYASTCQHCYKGKCTSGHAMRESMLIERLTMV